VTRLRPEVAEQAVELLEAMALPIAKEVEVFKTASRIARDLNHHLFDTLYHAVALEHGSTLVSADDTYYRKAQHLGGLVRLEA